MPDSLKTNLLEVRLFRVGCWISVYTSLFLFILDTFINKDYQASVIEFLALVLFTTFLYLSHKKPTQQNRHLFVLTILIFVNSTFLLEQGWTIPSAIVFFICIFYVTILIETKYSMLITIILLINFAVLTAYELLFISEIKYYSFDLKQVQFIHNVFTVLSVTVAVFLINYFKIMFDRENFAINAVNSQLNHKINEFSNKNKDLYRIQEDIREKQALLKLNSERLKKANKELEEIKLSLEETVRNRKEELSRVNEELSMLFYRSSHDFRRPLTTLKGLAQFSKLSEHPEIPQKILLLVDQTADTMSRMLDKFLMLYQINDLPRYPATNWDKIEASIHQLVNSINNVELNININTKKYSFNDRRNFLLEIIIKNLVENCCFYRFDDKTTHIDVKIEEMGNTLHLSIWDDGQGIPDEIKERIFEIYFRGNKASKGNGLGLYVVKSAVDKLKGSITVSSKENEFTQFDVVFEI